MEDKNEIQRIRGLVVSAMQLSTDSVTAAGSVRIETLALDSVAQAQHLARCIAVFTTDDALADEMEEIVDESPAFLASKVMALRGELKKFAGEFAALEKSVWTLVYAGRRERARVMQTLVRRKAI